MTAKLIDKVAIITGASSGIGEATALALAFTSLARRIKIAAFMLSQNTLTQSALHLKGLRISKNQ